MGEFCSAGNFKIAEIWQGVSFAWWKVKMSLKAQIWAWEQQVGSPTAKMILLKLADNTNDETGQCFPRHDTIAKHCECSRRTVIRNIKKLVELGLIVIQKNYREGKQIRNSYRLNMGHLGVTKCHSRCDIDDTLGVTECHTNEPVSITSKSITSEKLNFSDDDEKLARFMFKKIQTINPNHRQPNFKKWANTIRLIRERDKKTHREIQDLFLWANNDDFWQANILSPEKLREKFDQLTLQRNRNEGNGNGTGRFSKRSGQALQQANAETFAEIERLEHEIQQIELEERQAMGAGISETLGNSENALPAPWVR